MTNPCGRHWQTGKNAGSRKSTSKVCWNGDRSGLKGESPFWLSSLHAFVEKRIDDFVASKAWQHRFDKLMKDFLESELTKHHDLIPGIIRERLDEFSDDALVQFVEDKVQDDLQMIRINGAVVGSLVGMGLYLLVWVAERVWGA